MRPANRLVVAMIGMLVLAMPGPAYAEQPRQLRVMSYNIHHGAGVDGVLDLERIARVIEDSGADIVALQEVDKHWSARSNWVDQPGWFAERLGMHSTYAANLDLDPVNPGEPRRQYGTLILSRYRIRGSHNTLLPKYPGQEQRGLLEATIKARGRWVRIADTHLTHNNVPERQEQVERVVEVLGDSDLPVVVLGDLNAVPTSREITTLTAVFKDTWDEVGVGPGYTYDSVRPDRRIDYILHSTRITAESAAVIPTQASDHLPLVATLRLPHR
jgi:endonuclease/exonuclease/phosphatase family metal-dependent hydrolase